MQQRPKAGAFTETETQKTAPLLRKRFFIGDVGHLSHNTYNLTTALYIAHRRCILNINDVEYTAEQEKTMNEAKLAELFGGLHRLKLIRALFLNPARGYSIPQLQVMTDVDRGNLSRWLNRWSEIGLVEKIVSGRNISFRASADPTLTGLTDIARHSDEILGDIAQALPEDTDVAVIFGSMSRGEENAGSDIDILVLGDSLSSIQVNAKLKPVGRKHHRDINATVYTRAEFEELLASGNGFARNLIEQKTIPLIGDFRYAQNAH